jgi:hypothetical protein
VVPIDGLAVLEATMLGSMATGVLVGLLIADSALPPKNSISRVPHD